MTPKIEQWDDKNKISGDGWDIYCQIEYGWACTTDYSALINSICSEIWGDGKKIGINPCDDGNIISGDGCSSTWNIETGFTWTGGNPTKKDTWSEIWGDGRDFGYNECEDGNIINGDGCSSTCEFEMCYECTGGTPISIDSWHKLYITPTINLISKSNKIEIGFNYTMRQVNINLDYLSISISQDYPIIFNWNAYYSNNQTLIINIDSQTVLTGTEKISINFINYKIWRGPYGGCLTTSQLSTNTKNSLADSVSAAQTVSIFAQYSSYVGILITVILVIIGGGSLEMIWALINALQLIK